MGILKLLLSKNGIYGIIAVMLFGAGVSALYYLKYRPIRNEVITLRAENKALRKELKTQTSVKNAVFAEYSKLANLPRYKIDQHLDRIKVKKGSSLMFDPSAVMTITDTLQTDSVEIQIDTLKLEKRSFWDKLFGR